MAGYKLYDSPDTIQNLPSWLNWVAGPTDTNPLQEAMARQNAFDIQDMTRQQAVRQKAEQDALADVFRQNPDKSYEDLYPDVRRALGSEGDWKGIEGLETSRQNREDKKKTDEEQARDYRLRAAATVAGLGDPATGNMILQPDYPGANMTGKQYKPEKEKEKDLKLWERVDPTTGAIDTRYIEKGLVDVEAEALAGGFVPADPHTKQGQTVHADLVSEVEKLRKAAAMATPGPSLLKRGLNYLGFPNDAPDPAMVAPAPLPIPGGDPTIPRAGAFAPTPIPTPISLGRNLGQLRQKPRQ